MFSQFNTISLASSAYMSYNLNSPSNDINPRLQYFLSLLYCHRSTLSRKFPKEFLKDYQGYLHTDCYGGYNDLEDSEQTPKYSPPKNNKKIKRCLCLVHLRRYFVDALEGKNKGKLEDSLNNKLA